MLDTILKWPAPVRHLLAILLGVILAWLGTDILPVLEDMPGSGALAAGLLTAFLAYVTPLVSSYGVGAARARELGAATVAEVQNEQH